jgi:hypothetical protein
MHPFFTRRPETYFPRSLYRLVRDCFAVVQCWEPYHLSGSDRGRMFERLFCQYCDSQRLPLSEVPGSRTLCGQRSASGYGHESDAVIALPDLTVHIELKYLSCELGKNEFLIFNQKGLDFIAAANASLRKRPLYRIVVSGRLISQEARRFALQWGIITVEPDRLPLLIVHELSGQRVPDLDCETVLAEDQIWQEVPQILVPLQKRIRRLAALLDGDEALISEPRMERVLELYQLQHGDAYWDALDRTDPGWLESAFDGLRLDI